MQVPAKTTWTGISPMPLDKNPKAAELLARILQELNIHRLKGGEAYFVEGVIPDEVMLVLEQLGAEDEDLEVEYFQ